ncbi:hypothetical protein Lalb_Chr24g0394281 [Lupinus albus]|uniref:Nodulin homeobox C-terminal domain-containing protein n=1 Tax=Lupinus albus TaxID=3870 RepID=A0A6A4N649_LUPAL|nr:hypothetical protein Lalb_Chr24g0394281 [Lupinus albus]
MNECNEITPSLNIFLSFSSPFTSPNKTHRITSTLGGSASIYSSNSISFIFQHFIIFIISSTSRLNNRKARLARTAKDPGDASQARQDVSSLTRLGSGDTPEPSLAGNVNVGSPEFVIRKSAGQNVMLIGGQGEEIGNGKVFMVSGKWYGKSLEETGTCVVDVTELKVDKALRLPYPSEATGTSFSEAESKLGVMRVLWDLQRLHTLQPK